MVFTAVYSDFPLGLPFRTLSLHPCKGAWSQQCHQHVSPRKEANQTKTNSYDRKFIKQIQWAQNVVEGSADVF